jgi:prepilin-type N-terminal cleavage/methylation domain-containing protein
MNLSTADKGLTLVEAIVVIVVLSILMFAVMHVMVEGFRVWWENKNYIELRADGRFALARLTAEFRQAESVSQSTSTDITFDSDMDDDGDPETITYSLSGSDLVRGVQGSGQAVICGNVSSLTFSWNSPVLTAQIGLSRQGDLVELSKDTTARCLP